MEKSRQQGEPRCHADEAHRKASEAAKFAKESSARMRQADTCRETRAAILARFNKAFPSREAS